jgi:predicted dithiol-disulfide oxidoreductase (DUF899 family)
VGYGDFLTTRSLPSAGDDFKLLDLTPFGRQEDWWRSPEGWPQTPALTCWRLHDEY